MPLTTESLHAERAELITQAKAVVAKATDSGRDVLSPAEQVEVSDLLERVKLVDRQTKGRELVQSVIGLGSADLDNELHSDGFGSSKSNVFTPEQARGLTSAIKSRGNFRLEVSAKAALMSTLLPTSGSGTVPGLHPNGIVTLSSLFANEAVSSPVVRYYSMASATAGIVAEGAAKMDAGLVVTPKDATLVKIATTSQITDELSSDAPYLVDAIAIELQSAVAVAENTHIVSALLAASGILTNTATAATLIDVLATEVAVQTAANGVIPSAVILHPTQLATLRQAKASTSGEYHFDPLSAAPATVHGVPLVPTPSTAANTVIVVAGRAATFYRRGPVTVELGTNTDDWIKNVRTMRVEERVALAVQRPSMISKVTVS